MLDGAKAAILASAAAAVLLVGLRRRRPASLDEIGLRYVGTAGTKAADKYVGGDKTSEGQNFTSCYDALLASKRHAPGIEFLEIGVWYGKSLAMWAGTCGAIGGHAPPLAATHHGADLLLCSVADYFTSGSCCIRGVDINLRRWREHHPVLQRMGAFSRNSVEVYEFDTYSDSFATFARSALPPLDVVLDDGNHTAESQWHLFQLLFPRLKPGGVYIIEDIEQPAEVFTLGGASDGGRGTFFAAVLAHVAHGTYAQSQAVQREAERRAERAAARHINSKEQLRRQLASLREKHRALASGARGKGGSPNPAKGPVQGKADGKPTQSATEQIESAIRAKTAEVDAMPDHLSRDEQKRVRTAFIAAVEAAVALADDVASVEVRRNNLVFVRKH